MRPSVINYGFPGLQIRLVIDPVPTPNLITPSPGMSFSPEWITPPRLREHRVCGEPIVAMGGIRRRALARGIPAGKSAFVMRHKRPVLRGSIGLFGAPQP